MMLCLITLNQLLIGEHQLKGLLHNIWDNSRTFDEFRAAIEKQGYKVTDEDYLRDKFNTDKQPNLYPAIAYVPSHPTITQLRSQV